MKDLIRFIEGLKELEFESVVLDVPCEEGAELIRLDDLLTKIKELGVKEVVDEYFESFEFIDECGNYIEINGVY